MPIVEQFDAIEKPRVRLHIGPPHRDEEHTGFVAGIGTSTPEDREQGR